MSGNARPSSHSRNGVGRRCGLGRARSVAEIFVRALRLRVVEQQLGVAKQQVGHVERQQIPKVDRRRAALAILAFGVVYAFASLANGSLASGLIEISIVAGVVVILLLALWLLTRNTTASRRVGAGRPPRRGRRCAGSSWPSGKFAPRAEKRRRDDAAMPSGRPAARW